MMQSRFLSAGLVFFVSLAACGGDEKQEPTVRPVGAACVSDEECNDPPDALCLKEVGGGVVPMTQLPGGYCSKYCTEAEECGSGDPACFSLGTKNSGISICAASCLAPEDCRQDEGYGCLTLIPGFPGFCVPG